MKKRIAHISDLHFVSWKSAVWTTVKLLAGFTALGGAVWLLKRNRNAWPEFLKLLNLQSESTVNWKLLAAALPAGTIALLEVVPLIMQAIQFRKSSQANMDALLDHFAKEHPDHVAITGDLTNVAHGDEFRLAQTFVHKLESIVGKNGVTVIPGNHDADAWFSAVTGTVPPEKKLANYLKHFEEYHQKDHGHYFPTARVVGDVYLLGLDSTGSNFIVPGSVTPDQLDRAGDMLESSTARNCYKVLLLHHHLKPRPTLPASLLLRLGEGIKDLALPGFTRPEDVLRLAEEKRVGHILHGHVHEMYELGDNPMLECAGSTPSPADPEGENLYYNMLVWENGSMHAEPRAVPIPKVRK